MTVGRSIAYVGTVLLALAVLAAYLLVGTATSIALDDNLTVHTRSNILGQIGANVVVFNSGSESVLVDTQLKPLGRLTRSNVDAAATGTITAVVVTHWHPDHSGGIATFSGDAAVIAHANVKKRLSVPQQGFGLTKPGSSHSFPARSVDGQPNQTMTDQLELAIGASVLDVVHYPNAHTDGDVAVFVHSSQVVILGDLVWPDSFPFVDIHNGGSAKGLEKALRSIVQNTTDDYRYIPGHGAAIDSQYLNVYLEMISDTRRHVEAEIASGKALDDIVSDGVPERWQRWSSPLVPWPRWIRMIHSSGD